MISTIDDLVKAIDINVEDITELRVFRLKHSPPQEMADILYGLFPDDTRTDSTGGGRNNNVRFGGGFGGANPFGGGRAGGGAATSQASDRMKKMGRVLAVPDMRTSSIIVSAARDLMVQIEQMINQIDSDPARKQKMYVFTVQNASVDEVQTVLTDMFGRNTTTSRNTQNQSSALTTRATQAAQQNANSSSASRSSSSFGSSGGGGGRGGF